MQQPASLWNDFRSNVRGMLVGSVGAGLAGIALGLGQDLFIWIPAQVCSLLNFSLLVGSGAALWMAATPPSLHGRFFAARAVIDDIADMVVVLLTGVLADHVFEPAMTHRVCCNLGSPLFWEPMLGPELPCCMWDVRQGCF